MYPEKNYAYYIVLVIACMVIILNLAGVFVSLVFSQKDKPIQE